MINYSNSFRTMLQVLRDSNDDNIAEVLLHSEFLTNESLDYVTMRGQLASYLPAGREHKVNEEGRWSREGRQEVKIGRIVRKIISEQTWERFNLQEKDIETFSNRVASYVMCNGDGENDDSNTISLHVCNGEFISDYYCYSYNNEWSSMAGGNLLGSCMNGKDEDYFQLYSCNPDVINMVVALDSQRKLAGRALLWKTTDYGWCMDTIYASESIRPMFIDFAIKNNMRYKGSQSCHHCTFDYKDGVQIATPWPKYTVKLQESDFCEYPYLDTMYCLTQDNDELTNFEPDGLFYRLRNTDGGWDEVDNNGIYDDFTGDTIDEGDAIWLDYRRPNGDRFTGNTHVDNTTYCRGEGETYLSEDCVYVRSRGEYYRYDDDDIGYCDESGEYHLYEDLTEDYRGYMICSDLLVEMFDGRYSLERRCVEMHDGKYALINDCVLMHNHKYALEIHCVRLENGDYALVDDTISYTREDGSVEYILIGQTSETLVTQ